MSQTAIPISTSRSILGESPVWSAAEAALYWVDIAGKLIWRCDPATGAERSWPTPDLVGAVTLRHSGGLLAALKTGLFHVDPADGSLSPFASPDADRPNNRSNEMRCDAQGRIWLGTMQNNIGPEAQDLPIVASTGRLHRVLPDGTSTVMLDEVGISNTLCWSPDGATLYFADTLTGRIDAWDFDAATGEIGGRRFFASFHRGYPDGSAMDAEGHLWNCRWGGGCIVRFSPQGTVDRVVDLPVANPTSCAFGGPDLTTLFVTSAKGSAKGPLDGATLCFDPGVKGLPVGEFAG